MGYSDRLQRFQNAIADQIDLAFLPISSDLEYLIGIPRGIPSFGAVIHPGAWLEGTGSRRTLPPCSCCRV